MHTCACLCPLCVSAGLGDALSAGMDLASTSSAPWAPCSAPLAPSCGTGLESSSPPDPAVPAGVVLAVDLSWTGSRGRFCQILEPQGHSGPLTTTGHIPGNPAWPLRLRSCDPRSWACSCPFGLLLAHTVTGLPGPWTQGSCTGGLRYAMGTPSEILSD